MTGTEKMDLVVIGKSKQSRAFRKFNTKLVKFLYFNNQAAWQNRSTFAEWLRHFDAKMHGRRVLLLLDNASCHYGAAECYNVSWHSSRQTRQYICNRSTQVCLNGCSPDQQFLTFFLLGIMWSFKARYRKKLVLWLLDAIHTRIDRKLDILEVVRFAISSWEVVPEQVTHNC